jgi:hypothetical protein
MLAVKNPVTRRDVSRALRSDRPRRRRLTASCGLRVGLRGAPLLCFVATRVDVVQAGSAAPESDFVVSQGFVLGFTARTP